MTLFSHFWYFCCINDTGGCYNKSKGINPRRPRESCWRKQKHCAKWETGNIANMGRDKIVAVSKALNVSPSELLNWDTNPPIKNIYPARRQDFPLLGTIAAGEPIFTEERVSVLVSGAVNIDADFCLKVQGDSMINASIDDGDIVFVKKQSLVDDGDITAVLINEVYGDTATLKRVYYDKVDNSIQLVAENPKYHPLVYSCERLNDIRILGKAVALHKDL